MTRSGAHERRLTEIIPFAFALVVVLWCADAQAVTYLCPPGPPAVDRGPAVPQVTDCTVQPDGTSCDDGNACDGTDTCSAGGCAGTMIADDGLRLDRLSPESSTAVITWNLAPGATGSDLIRGLVSALPVSPTDQGENLLLRNTGSTDDQDEAVPAPGTAFWYLVRGRTACGGGPWGFATRNGLVTTQRQPREGCVLNVNASTRYIDHGMTVTDLSTCLEWEKKGQTGESSLHNAPDKYDWNAAVGYWLALVNDEFFAGHNDWRLPSEDGVIDVASSVRELLSIVDCGFRPTINPIFGPTATFTGYWSSTSDDDAIDVVEYTDGWEYQQFVNMKQAVRAVRGGP